MRFAGAPPPGYVLDALYASLEPLRARLTEVWVKATTAWAPENTKAAWVGQLKLASDWLTDASIEGQLGQRLAMGDATLSAWKARVEAAADLTESIAANVGMDSYSIPRLWREVVVPTAQQVAEKVPEVGGALIDWGPLVLGGVGLLLLAWRFAPQRSLAGLAGGRRRKLRK